MSCRVTLEMDINALNSHDITDELVRSTPWGQENMNLPDKI